jgi:SAM-dependent methyltransferase
MSGSRALNLRILYLSAVILFIEMLLIRWIGTEVRAFAYVQSGILVAAFLGLGLGCRASREPVKILHAPLAFAAIALVIKDPFRLEPAEAISQGLVAYQEAAIWFSASRLPQFSRTALALFALLGTLGLLFAVVTVFRPLGQWLGAWIDQAEKPIPAYTANILGSLVGIGVFVLCTVRQYPPRIWIAIAGLGLASCVVWSRENRIRQFLTVLVALALPILPPVPDKPTFWSPYQKLDVSPNEVMLQGGAVRGVCGLRINVNQVGYQAMLDLDQTKMAQNPVLYPPEQISRSHYVLPYSLVGNRTRVLVVGAGSGNDVAAALQAGAGSVQAVEIDPSIVELGRQLHPNRPYASPKVTVTIDDARAFFGRAEGAFDLVWFGLLDSHTNPSAYSNVRLDHFVYTQESLLGVKKLLAKDGVVVLLFDPQTAWIGSRLNKLITQTFGNPPVALKVQGASGCLGWGGLLLIGGSPEALASVRGRLAADPVLQPVVFNPEDDNIEVTSDDWPYLYLEKRGLPRFHIVIGCSALLLLFILRRRLFRAGEPLDWPMALLGMGFMLLETVSVSRAALLFGTTWTVNAYVIGSILMMTLIANYVASRISVPPRGWPGMGLIVSLVLLRVISMPYLASLPGGARILIGGGFLVLPVLFSSLIFVSAWARSERKDLALGSNLLGGLMGGAASLLTMSFGFNALILLNLAVYVAALAVLRPVSRG